MNITINNKDYTQYITKDNGAKYNNLITLDMIKNWNKNKLQFLNGGTGTGKSYFILYNLSKFARENNYKILYLCNRKKLRKQMEDDTNSTYNFDIVTVMSYQKLQNMINNKEYIPTFDIIVADECHYFKTDATFNILTDLSYNWFIKQDSYKICMSATYQQILQKLKKDIEIENLYTIIKNYNYVKEIIMLCGDNNMKDLIENLMLNTPENEKIIYFCRKSDVAFELYNEYKENACFYVSESNKYSQYNTYINENKDIFIKSADKNGNKLITFPKKVLFTTCVLDNGVNIIDKNVKHLITDLIDTDKLIQCLGRKRVIDKDDTCKFYIKNWSKQELSRVKNGLMRDVKPAMDFFANEEEFNDKYLGTEEKERTFYNKFIYTTVEGKRKLKEMSFYKQIDDIAAIDIMMMKKHNFKSYLFGDMCGGNNDIKSDLYDITVEWDFIKENEKNELENYLDIIVNKRLFKDEQQELSNLIIKELTTISSNVDYRTKLLKPSTIENLLRKQLKLPYVVSDKGNNVNPKTNKKGRWIMITKIN